MGRENALLFIKLLHTAVWSFFVFIIFYVVHSGISGKITPFTWISIGLVVGEGLILLLFKMFCPITLIARKYSDSKKENFDIFLPNWLAKYNKIIFTTIYLIGVLLVLLRFYNIL